MLPASTRIVYAAQGENWDAVEADLAKPPHMTSSIHWLSCYVMISRARSLERFLALRLAERAELEEGAPQYLLDEIDRLLQLEAAGTSKLRDFLQSVRHVIPHDVLQLFDDDAEQRERNALAVARGAHEPHNVRAAPIARPSKRLRQKTPPPAPAEPVSCLLYTSPSPRDRG